MLRADVKLGFSCNNHCRFCVQGNKRNEYPDLGTEEARRVLAEERQHCEDVVLTGGEVTIRKDLPELIAHARELGYRTIQLQTNGRLIASRERLQAFVDAGITEVSPAIHGATAEMHDGLTRAPGSFRQTVKGVLNARRLGLPVIMNSVITRANYRELPFLAELFLRLGVTQFQFAFVHALGSAADNFDEMVPRYTDVMPFVRQGLKIGRRNGLPCMTEAIPLCFLDGIEHMAAEHLIPDTRIRDAVMTVADYTRARKTEGKAHGPPCVGCRWEQTCEGPWKEYPEHFGWDELQTVPPVP